MNKTADIIHPQQPVSQLGLSDRFTRGCREMGFEKLGDIFELKPGELVQKSGFSYLWLEEFSSFLDKNNAMHLLQAIPGSRTF